MPANVSSAASAATIIASSRIPLRGSTTDDVTDALREAILDGTLPPLTWLREQDLARSLQVSRTPVREALRRLADEQLVDRAANRGCQVRALTIEDVMAVYVVREALEGLAARMAASRPSADLIAKLIAIEDRMTASSDASELATLNLEFHSTIRDSTHNAYLDRFLGQVENAVRRFGSSSLETPGRRAECHIEHQAIMHAIAEGDAVRAHSAAVEHMQNARKARIARLLNDMTEQ